MSTQPVVITGGGFAGVYTARELLKQGISVLLISETNHFTFTPLLHEVATGSLISHDVIFGYESFFRTPKFDFVRGRVEGIDREAKTVMVGSTAISYSQLVISTGATTNFRDLKGVEHAHVLKNVEDAVRLKQAIVSNAQDLDHRIDISVIGGGPTGLELVFDIDLMMRSLRRRCADTSYTLRLVHLRDTFCSTQSETIQDYIRQALDKAGVEVVCNAYAKAITTSTVETTEGVFDSDVTVMCAGVRPNTQPFAQDLTLDDHGHIEVNSYMQSLQDPHIFAVGDVAALDGKPLPKLAQTAVREAPVVAKNIVAQRMGSQMVATYRPRVVGILFSLGFGDGVGSVYGRTVKGVFAWWLWRTIYLFKTPGLSNKLRVAFSWTLGLFKGRNLTEL